MESRRKRRLLHQPDPARQFDSIVARTTSFSIRQLKTSARRASPRSGTLFVEHWLNSTLEHSTPHHSADSSLRRYDIDKNSLRDLGLSDQLIERLYSSLFVYSCGFHLLIKDLTSAVPGGGGSLASKLWKVFNVLVEGMDPVQSGTVIGELRKSHQLQIQKMAVTLRGALEKSQQAESGAMARIEQAEKTVTSLQQAFQTVSVEKGLVESELQTLDEAFAKEVENRLKFENKVNLIYSVHRELKVKHQRLHDKMLRLQHELGGARAQHAAALERVVLLEKDVAAKSSALEQAEVRVRELEVLNTIHEESISEYKRRLQTTTQALLQAEKREELGRRSEALQEVELKDRRKDLVTLKRLIEENGRQIEILRAERTEGQTVVKNIRKQLDGKQQQVYRLEIRVEELGLQLRSRDQRINMLKAKVLEQDSQLERNREQVVAAVVEKDELGEQLKGAERNLLQQQQLIQQMRTAKLQVELERDQRQAVVMLRDKEIASLLQQVSNLEATLQERNSELELAMLEASKFRQETSNIIEGLNREKKELKKEVKQGEERLAEVEARLKAELKRVEDELARILAQRDKDMADLRHLCEQREARGNDLAARLGQQQSRCEGLLANLQAGHAREQKLSEQLERLIAVGQELDRSYRERSQQSVRLIRLKEEDLKQARNEHLTMVRQDYRGQLLVGQEQADRLLDRVSQKQQIIQRMAETQAIHTKEIESLRMGARAKDELLAQQKKSQAKEREDWAKRENQFRDEVKALQNDSRDLREIVATNKRESQEREARLKQEADKDAARLRAEADKTLAKLNEVQRTLADKQAMVAELERRMQEKPAVEEVGCQTTQITLQPPRPSATPTPRQVVSEQAKSSVDNKEQLSSRRQSPRESREEGQVVNRVAVERQERVVPESAEQKAVRVQRQKNEGFKQSLRLAFRRQ